MYPLVGVVLHYELCNCSSHAKLLRPSEMRMSMNAYWGIMMSAQQPAEALLYCYQQHSTLRTWSHSNSTLVAEPSVTLTLVLGPSWYALSSATLTDPCSSKLGLLGEADMCFAQFHVVLTQGCGQQYSCSIYWNMINITILATLG